MRRAALLAVVLVLMVVGVAQGAGPSAKVTGQFAYTRGWFEQPDILYTHTVALKASTDPARGTYLFTSSDGRWFMGTVTCAVVDGPDAWVAGPASSGSEPGMAMFFHIYDGATKGSDRVVAVVDYPDAADQACQDKDVGYPLFPLDFGRVKVTGR